MELCGRLKHLRLEWALSQKGMAERLDISVSAYQYYERGERDMPAKLLVKITTFGVNPIWLLLGTGDIFFSVIEEKKAANGDVIDYHSPIEAEHMRLVKQFKNKERAKLINEHLVELEGIDEGLFNTVEAYLNGVVSSAKVLKGQQDGSKQTGRSGGEKKVNER